MIHPTRPRFLSEADCRDVAGRLSRFSAGGGYSCVSIMSTWRGNVRWARNRISTSGDTRDNAITVQRNIRGALGEVWINDTTDVALMAASRRAERLAAVAWEKPNSDLIARLPQEPGTAPQLFSEATYQLDADRRAAAAVELTKQARDAGMLSAGYIEVAAVGMAVLDTLDRVRYFAYTQARYSVTVRDPEGTGSGWAGVDWYDWRKIDTHALTQRALQKCLTSRHPVAIEPGRYTTILEPQAVSDFVGPFIRGGLNPVHAAAIVRSRNVHPGGPFFKSGGTGGKVGYSKIGEQVVDERITIGADPTDPELGFPPFKIDYTDDRGDQFTMPVFHPVTWIDHGVLTTLAYDRFEDYGGLAGRDKNLGMPNSGAFRMSGGVTPIEEMVATAKRGLLVTRFDKVIQLDFTAQLYRGYTRDGLWLIEDGKISKPVKNMVFTESVLFALNSIDQLGPPQRVFHPNVALLYGFQQPTVVPPMKVKDFSFTSLADAV